ncbi:MAG: phage head-tail connector protein [Rhodobiaceae bacterium]|nr:head-tail connector protein [Rhodobiaceae bacterium]MCC0016633.1 phage head-tail connector protein [Rhodobiaceae bacterium]MCC0042285.1 phage head-tail connector protein [Rhodobiaceae bacterium]
MTMILVTPPASEPVSLAEAKAFLRLDNSDDDTLIDTLIATARVALELRTGRYFVTQGWRYVRDAWPSSRLVSLPASPLQSVDAVTVYDDDGDPAVLPATGYIVDTASVPPRLKLRSSALADPGQALNGIEIDLTAGYGTAADVPAPLKTAILQLVAHWYESREPVAFGDAANPVPQTVDALVAPYKLVAL